MSQPLAFASAYRQLPPAEKAFTDAYVARIERECAQRNERISAALYRAIPSDVIQASRGMLDKPLVRAAITERINQIAADSELTAHRVIKELMAVGFSSVADFMELGEDGLLHVKMEKATPEQLASLASYEIIENMTRQGMVRTIKFKLHDKLAAIDKLMRYMGLLDPDNPFWKADKPQGDTPTMLPASITVESAADEYARLLDG